MSSIPVDRSRGYVYVLSNESMPGILKIGYTTTSAENRAKGLYAQNTSVPTQFEVEFSIFTREPYAVEQNIHAELEECRVSAKREFFRMGVPEAIQVVSRCAIANMDVDLTVEHLDYAIDPGDHAHICHRTGVFPPALVQLINKVPDHIWIELNEQREARINDAIQAKTRDSRALKLAVSNIQHRPTDASEVDSCIPKHVHEREQAQSMAVSGADNAGLQYGEEHCPGAQQDAGERGMAGQGSWRQD